MSHGPFASIDISNSGLGFNKYWLDTIAHDIANVDAVLREVSEHAGDGAGRERQASVS